MPTHQFVRSHDNYHLVSTLEGDRLDRLPPGNYVVSQNSLTGQFYLERAPAFDLPAKLYGDVERNVSRFLRTFADRTVNTGVLLAGDKGSGKTLTAKLLVNRAAEAGIPTLLVNNPYVGDGFNQFLQSIPHECVVLFDEFEKVYENTNRENASPQVGLLTLLDGVFPSKKLFLFTVNNTHGVNEHMRDRPGRIYYRIDYEGLEPSFVEEYCRAELADQSKIASVGTVMSMFQRSSFDVLKAVVEEVNRYGESALNAIRFLNAKPLEDGVPDSYGLTLWRKGKDVTDPSDRKWRGNPMSTEAFSVEDVDAIYHHFERSQLTKIDVSAGVFRYRNEEGYDLHLVRNRSRFSLDHAYELMG